jgi:hypothetical protein
MHRYGTRLHDIDNVANILPLKPDIHDCFDNRWLIIVPKVGTHPPSKYVSHILSADAAELWPTYHNVIVQNLHPVSRPYLFARFAWAVIFQVKTFVTSGISRHVVRIRVTTDTNGEEKIERKKEFLSGRELINSYGGGGLKSATPKKRSSPTTSADDDGNLAEWSSEDGDIGIEDRDFWRGRMESWIRETPSETVPDASPRDKKPLVGTADSLPGGEDDIEMNLKSKLLFPS